MENKILAKFSPSTGGIYPVNAYAEFPDDATHIPEALYARFQSGEISGFDIKNGKVVEAESVPLTADEMLAWLEAGVQSHLDETARGMGYDSIYTAISYAEEPVVPKFQKEGRALRAWRSLVWERCHEVVSEVQSGVREIPTAEELIALLPAFEMLE